MDVVAVAFILEFPRVVVPPPLPPTKTVTELEVVVCAPVELPVVVALGLKVVVMWSPSARVTVVL